MQQEEQYTLTWQNYSDHLRDNLREMMLSGEFTDVILHTTGAASFFPETNMSQLSEHASQSVCLYILLLLASYERCLTYLMLFYFRYVDIINRK